MAGGHAIFKQVQLNYLCPKIAAFPPLLSLSHSIPPLPRLPRHNENYICEGLNSNLAQLFIRGLP